MSSAFKLAWLIFVAACAPLLCGAPPTLRVCADPNNLPYSNHQQQGFENQLAEMLAKDLGMQLAYFWFPQRGAFFEKTLNSGACDVVMGVPAGFGEADTTSAYYRSTYVFVSRARENLHLRSFDDPRLKQLRIGVHVLGNGDDSLPPVYALTTRGIVRNVTGYSIFGPDLNETNPPEFLLEAVAKKQIDVAIAWGPMAGYFALHSAVPLEITPVEKDKLNPELPLSFDIAIGIRKGNEDLRRKLDAELVRQHAEIVNLLKSYGIGQFSAPAAAQTPAGSAVSIVEN